MRLFIKHLFLLVLLLNIGLANAALDDWEFNPVVGVDVGMRNQAFHPSFGDHHFRENFPDTNVYMGFHLHKYFAFETGYGHMYRQTKQSYYDNPIPVLGFTGHNGLGAKSFISDVHTQGWNVNLLGAWPVWDEIELIGIFGAGWLRMHFDTMLIQDGNAANRLTEWSSDRRTVLRAGAGLRYFVTKHFGVRFLWVWENTSKLEATTAVGVDTNGVAVPTVMVHNYTVRPKDSHTFGLGFVLKTT